MYVCAFPSPCRTFINRATARPKVVMQFKCCLFCVVVWFACWYWCCAFICSTCRINNSHLCVLSFILIYLTIIDDTHPRARELQTNLPPSRFPALLAFVFGRFASPPFLRHASKNHHLQTRHMTLSSLAIQLPAFCCKRPPPIPPFSSPVAHCATTITTATWAGQSGGLPPGESGEISHCTEQNYLNSIRNVHLIDNNNSTPGFIYTIRQQRFCGLRVAKPTINLISLSV